MKNIRGLPCLEHWIDYLCVYFHLHHVVGGEADLGGQEEKRAEVHRNTEVDVVNGQDTRTTLSVEIIFSKFTSIGKAFQKQDQIQENFW